MTFLLYHPLRIVAIALFAVVTSGCGKQPTSNTDTPAALVVAPYTVTAATQYLAEQRFSGQVEAARQSALGFELGGELAAVLVDEGGQVANGALLARLDRSRSEAARDEAAAALAQARAQAALSEASYARISAARSFDGVSAQEVDQALEQKQRSEAAATAALARLQRLDIDLAKTELRAPYAGNIVRRYADEGQVLAAGQPVLEIQESAALEVRLAVTGDAAAALAEGAQVSLVIGERAVTANVSAIIARRDLQTRSVEVILALSEGAPARVGDIAELSYARVIREAGFWVPVDALTEGARGIWSVMAVRGDSGDAERATWRATGATHALEKRPVELLYEEADRVFVRGALQDGDIIVAAGLHRVVAGQGVRVGNAIVAERSASETVQ